MPAEHDDHQVATITDDRKAEPVNDRTTEPPKLRRCCAAELASGDRVLWRAGTAEVVAVGEPHDRYLLTSDLRLDDQPAGGDYYERRTYLTLTLRRDDGETETADVDARRRDLRLVTA